MSKKCRTTGCNNPVIGKSWYCEECKRERKLQQNKNSRKKQIALGRMDKSATHSADTYSLNKALVEGFNRDELEMLFSMRKKRIKYLNEDLKQLHRNKSMYDEDEYFEMYKKIKKQIQDIKTQMEMINRGWHKVVDESFLSLTNNILERNDEEENTD